MRKSQGRNKQKIVELLSERLAFERTGVKLYDQIVQKVLDERGTDGLGGDAEEIGERLAVFRDEEKEHEEWLEEKIRELGSDPNEQTDRSILVQEESRGIAEVVLESDRPIAELCHALLTAEIVDEAGWELLIEAAQGDRELVEKCRQCHREEERHLEFVKNLVLGFTRGDGKVEQISQVRARSQGSRSNAGSRSQRSGSKRRRAA